jgi:hypothetical protein
VPFKTSVVVVLLLEVGVVVLALLNYGWEIEGLQAIARYSGRLSLMIFSLIFLLHQQPGDLLTRILSGKYFLIFAVAHGVHLIELLAYVYFSNTVLIPYRLAGGMLAYSFIFAMPWIANKHERNLISDRNFHRLSLVYLYYVWFIFVMTYVPRVMGTLPNVGGSYTEFVVLLGWVFLLLGIKLSRLLIRPRVSSRN